MSAPAGRGAARALPRLAVHGGAPLDLSGGAPALGGVPGAPARSGTRRDVLDFSANTNPLGMSPAALAAARAALPLCDRYPDPACSQLRRAIAEREGLPGLEPGMVACGAGAADLVYRLARALSPARALVCAPTFSEYERALALEGCAVSRHRLAPERGFSLDEGVLDEIVPGVGLVALCEPNNPTGVVSDPALLREVLLRCERVGATLLVDECFLGFLDDAPARTMARYVAAHHRLVVLRAFTKLYGMAGLRLGYALCSDPALVEGLARAGAPWPVSTVAQAAGIAALGDDAFLAATRELVGAQRAALIGGIGELGLRVVEGRANYLLFRARGARLAERLAERGVLVRACGDFVGLDDAWCRVAVRLPGQNARLLDALAAEEGAPAARGAAGAGDGERGGRP